MRFDYQTAHPSLIGRILDENSRRLSRTRRGISNTETSHDKQPLLAAGTVLADKAKHNEQRVQEFIHVTRHEAVPADPESFLAVLSQLADLTNANLLPGSRFRTWHLPQRERVPDPWSEGTLLAGEVAPDQIEAALGQLSRLATARLAELQVSPIPLISWIEWHLNAGPLHPFYDGCGRISRSFAAVLYVRSNSLLPLYDDFEGYFAAASQGTVSFSGYVQDRVADCAAWIMT